MASRPWSNPIPVAWPRTARQMRWRKLRRMDLVVDAIYTPASQQPPFSHHRRGCQQSGEQAGCAVSHCNLKYAIRYNKHEFELCLKNVRQQAISESGRLDVTGLDSNR